jgi:hypothetical protein
MIKLNTFRYIDRQVGIEAFRMLIPSDWKFEGGILWLLDNPGMPAIVGFRVGNGTDEFEVFPNQSFYWTNDLMTTIMFPRGSKYFGNEMRPLENPNSTLRSIVLPRFRYGLKFNIIKEESLPDLARILKVEGKGSGAKIRIEYERDGKLMEEDIYCVVEYYEFDIPSFLGSTKNVIWFVDYIFSFKSKKGELEKNKELQTAASSFRLNPLWYSKYKDVIQYLTQMQIKQIRDIGELSRIISQTSNEIREENMRDYYARSEIMEKMNKDYGHYIRGTEEYYDETQGKNVELPSGHDDVWANNLGYYVLSDNPNYNPNSDKEINNLGWTKIERRI